MREALFTYKTINSEAKIIEEVAEWLVLMGEKPLDNEMLEKFEQWKKQSAAHQKAWEKAEILQKRLSDIPSSVSKKTFNQIRKKRMQSHKFIFICVIGSAVFGSIYIGQQKAWLADYHTAYGEQKNIVLKDGTQITLNSKTVIDVDFNDKQRKIVLHYGEIYVQTGHQSEHKSPPLFVNSQSGTIQSLGTQFDVEHINRFTAVSVIEHAVEIKPDDMQQTHVLSAGKQLEFNAEYIGDENPVSMDKFIWRSGLIIANRMPLEKFTQQIKKYYGVDMIADDNSKDLLISGTYPANNFADLLSTLKKTYSLKTEKKWFSQAIYISKQP